MQAVEATTLGDIPRESIERIEWMGFSGNTFKLTSKQQIDYWVRNFGSVPVRFTRNRWRTTEPSVPYRYFEVFI